MFLERLKLQLFAADIDEDNEIDDPEYGEQDDEIVDEDTDDDNVEDEPDEVADDEDENVENDEETEEETEEDKPFLVFKSKDEHQKYMDNIIGKRLGEQRKKQEEQEELLHTLQQYFDVEDIEGLKKKSEELLEDIAYQRGTTKEQLIKQQKEQRELRELRAMREEQKQIAFLNALTEDCNKLAELNPVLYGDLKPEKLARDKDFINLLSQGVSFKNAYDALHIEELVKKQAYKTKKNVIDDVKAKGTRITENASKKSKPVTTKIDVSKLTDEQLTELEERAARGEKITF